MKKFLMATVFSGLFAASAIAGSPTYIDNTPLASQVNTAVRDCAPMSKWPVNFISWGADEATIHANGGLTTVSGSNFDKAGLSVTLKREDDFVKQLNSYMKCETPFLRGTLGMAMLASDVTEADPRTRLIPIYQLSWSSGGDRLVARSNIRSISDLKGKTVVVQRYGPHIDYLLKLITDAGLSPTDVKIRVVNDITGDGDNTPSNAFRRDGTVDAVMVISPDADKLTLNNTVGTGAEGSVNGAHELISTRRGNRIIVDLIFVRKDFYEANKDRLAKFTKALLASEETVRSLASSKTADWTNLMRLSAKLILDNPNPLNKIDTSDAEGMWSDAETTGRQGNLRFFANPNEVRSYVTLVREIQDSYTKAGFISMRHTMAPADWNWQDVVGTTVSTTADQKFDPAQVSAAVSKAYAQGTVDSSQLMPPLVINFKPGQKDFNPNTYAAQFQRVVELANTYGGAVITAEGHADPKGYLDAIDRREDAVVLKRMVQAGRNLSVQRAQAVRDAIMAMAKDQGHPLDASQFEIVGLGYDKPRTGICGDLPCRPKTEMEWLSNMEVIFRVMDVQAEATSFK